MTIAGIAFAGDRGISRVEVSTDDGTSWADAELEPTLSELSWTRWRFDWSLMRTGLHTIRAHAWDETGRVTFSRRRSPHRTPTERYPLIAFTIDAV